MPQRFLRPGITNSERWNGISWRSQSFYIRLLTLVDDYGRCDGRASVLWGACFSVWNEKNPKVQCTLQQVADMLQELSEALLIEIYESEGKRFIQFVQWKERIRENTRSKWPDSTVAGSCSKLLLPTPSSPPSPYAPAILSGKPDEAKVLLSYLNESCGRQFREVDANLTVIRQRLAEPGVTVEGVQQMIDRQVRRWKGTEQEEYLRPETLFRKSKFDSYYAAKDLPVQTAGGLPVKKSIHQQDAERLKRQLEKI